MSSLSFYYVKLSCPSSKAGRDEAESFKELMKNITARTLVRAYHATNIPNRLSEAKEGDIVFLHIGGDTANKRSLFRDNQYLQAYNNGIYAVAKLIQTHPLDKEIVLDIFPLASCVSKMDLYIFPQFLDNLGCATKGTPNQAGLYELTSNQALSFIEYLSINDSLGVADKLVENLSFEGALSKGISDFIDKTPEFTQNKSNKLLAEHIIDQSSAEFEIHNASCSPQDHLSKPFLLLAGISGTGKTRFVRKQVEQGYGSLEENYCLTAVRPDWHEPSDLLGYVSRLGDKDEYITTDVLSFMAKAWRSAIDAGLKVQVKDARGRGKHLVVTGERRGLDRLKSYWLCLDEMNLAPVEQYFADYLSVLETREWDWSGDKFTYTCDPILKPATIQQIDEADLRVALGFKGDKYDTVWELINQYGLGLPLNLIVAGTVNMDETTHGFSRKVIDRALTIDFGEFFPNNIDEFFESKTQAKVLGFPTLSHVKLEHFQSVDVDNPASKTQHFFQSINKVLLGTPFELAFRAFNELSLSVVSNSPKNEVELAAVFDDFMMCKVLPRIEGDEDKLLDKEQNNLLEQLIEVLESQFENILLDLQRPDLFRELIDTPEESIDVPCRSLRKLQAMNRTLENGFTSFWP
ncbi:McrB family protein [Vibrio breoganii]|uniref:McrB family protein n=1 Tax=Vibrio breoganii TaxID=553239 RepID=UPI001F53CA87|nr:hypothetical protein [Vibrio breoganii]